MHIKSKNSINADLSLLLEELLKADVRFILVGGLAAVIQGAPVTTLDVDILYDPSPDNIEKLFVLLKSITAIYRRPDDKVIKPKKEDFLGKGYLLFTTHFGPLDVLAFIEEGKKYDELLEHTIEIEFRGHIIRVLDLKMIIDLKKTSKDPKDKQRLSVLEETFRQMEKGIR